MLRLGLCVLVGVGLAAAGCGKHETQGAGAGSDKPGAAGPVGAPQTAVLEGTVRLAEGYELPSYPEDAMERKVFEKLDRDATPTSCSPPRTTDRQPVQLSESGFLSGVLIAASEFSQKAQRPPQVHEVTIDDCRLTPPLVAAMRGDQLRVRNTMKYPFMPTYRETGMARTLLPGQTYEVTLDKPGVQPLLCGFTAPCGRTDVVVLMHPVYAVTDKEGKFRIDGFPANESIVLNAWHPLFEETKLQVRLEKGEHKSIELVLTPKVAPAAPSAPDSKGAAPAAPAPAPGAKKPAAAAGDKPPATH